MTLNDVKILYEDNHIIVAVKPQNMPTQGDISNDNNLLDILKSYVKEKYNKEGEAFLGLVHRLDRPTGGLLVFARNSKSAERLCKAMAEGDIEKRYLAVVQGVFANTNGKLVHHLMKDERDNIVRVVPFTTEGAKRAELDYRLLEARENISLIDISLLTGRSHQIRVQLSTISHPILGDAKYGGAAASRASKLCLWAYELRLKHPVTKENLVFKSFPPQDEAPWSLFYLDKYIGIHK